MSSSWPRSTTALDRGAHAFDLRTHRVDRFAVIVDADCFATPDVTAAQGARR
jgi:hypothetical protein